MKYFSTFSGIGGFELGIQLAYESKVSLRDGATKVATSDGVQQGVESTAKSTLSNGNIPDTKLRGDTGEISCIGYSEIDKYASQIYQKHFPEHKPYGDITKIVAEELPDFDLLVGGFPCQAFSIAGKRGGFEDTRGTMFFELARILRAKQPRLFVFENVKGLLSHDGGKSFSTIIQTLDELGYDCQWQVLNSKNHGVPQNRERVFIIGHLRGTPRPKVFPFGEDQQETTKCGVYTGTLTSRYPASQREGTYIEETRKPAGEIEQINQPKHSNDRVYAADGISLTLNTMQGGSRQPFIAAQRGRYNAEGKTEQTFEPRKDLLTNTLTTVEKDNNVIEGAKIRRLTPTECERLQGFPDGWTEGLSDTQRYKTLGNAVTVNVIRDIFYKINK